MSSRGNNRGRDQARGNSGKNIVAVHLTPFITPLRSTQMVLAVVDPLAATPVLLPHPLPFSPLVMPHVLVIIVVIVPPIIVVVLGKNRTEGKSCTHHCECNRFS